MLEYPISPRDREVLKKELRTLMSELIMDTFWDDVFYYFTNFDSAANVIKGAHGTEMTFENTGQASVTLDGWEVAAVASGSDNVSASFMEKVQIPTLGSAVALNRNLGWGVRQRFRANFSFYDSTDTDDPQHISYIVRGATPQSNFNHPNFGFKIIDTTLYGVCRNSSAAESTVELMTVANATGYIVEARYVPGEKIIFSVQDNSTFKMEEKGVLTSSDNLPNPTNANTSTFYGFEITRQEDHTVQLLGSFFEYIQINRRF